MKFSITIQPSAELVPGRGPGPKTAMAYVIDSPGPSFGYTYLLVADDDQTLTLAMDPEASVAIQGLLRTVATHTELVAGHG